MSKNIDLVKRRANVPRSNDGAPSRIGRRRRATRKIRRVAHFGKIAKLSKNGKPIKRRRAALILIYHKLTNCKVARAVERPKFAFFQSRENFRPKKFPFAPLFVVLIGPNASSSTVFAARRRLETPRQICRLSRKKRKVRFRALAPPLTRSPIPA